MSMGRAVNAAETTLFYFWFLVPHEQHVFLILLNSGGPQSGVKNEQRIHAPMMPQQMCMQMSLRSVSKCTLMVLMRSL